MAIVDPTIATSTERPAVGWIHGPRLDVALALCWVPFAVVGLAVQGDVSRLQWFAAAVLTLSLAHQPITLAMVYGDAAQFRLKRRVFTWTPVVLAAAVFVGLQLSFVLVAVIGGLWNTEHTLMQRYGITRIYRRKGGDTGPGRPDLLMLTSWLLLTLAWAVADPRTAERIEQLGLGTANRRGLQLLVDVRPYATVLLVLALGFALVTTGRWLLDERARGFDANPATYGYLAATGALFVVAAVHPLAGFLAWVGSHAVEYFIIVVTNLDRRYPKGQPTAAPFGRVVASPLRAIGAVAVFTVVVSSGVVYLGDHAPLKVYGMVFFCIGGMHIFYDGFIWKLRQPRVAESFDLTT